VKEQGYWFEEVGFETTLIKSEIKPLTQITSQNSSTILVGIVKTYNYKYEYCATNSDPQMILTFNRVLDAGWYEFTATIKTKRIIELLEIFVIRGGEFLPNVIRVPYNTKEVVKIVLKLDKNIDGIRIDPINREGDFSVRSLSIEKLEGNPSTNICNSVALIKKFYMTEFNDTHKSIREIYDDYNEVLSSASSFVNTNTNMAYLSQIVNSKNYFTEDKLDLFISGDIKFSIVMPTYNSNLKWLAEAIDSVRRQTYTNWQLCICDDNSVNQSVRDLINNYTEEDNRIELVINENNGGISTATNLALELTTGDWVCFMDHDDTLEAEALECYFKIISKNTEARLIYSDEDKIDVCGNRFDPHYKSDWNPELLLNHNYITHFVAVKRDGSNQLFLDKNFDGSQDYDFLLRWTKSLTSAQVIHSDKVLYHWRAHGGSTALNSSAKSYSIVNGKKALSSYLQSMGISADVSYGPFPNIYRVHRALETEPSVEIFIPTRDHLELLRPCLESILAKTAYQNYHITIIDNLSTENKVIDYIDFISAASSKVKKLLYPYPFNWSKINNFAAANSDAEVFIFMNNDIEIIDSEWLKELVSHAVRPEIGCVGAKLLYPDYTVQHAGVIVGLGGTAGHVHSGIGWHEPGYFSRALLSQNILAVTGAALAVSSKIFDEVQGFDERFEVAFNDIDFCLKVHETGYLNLFTPHSVMIHHESKSRGYEDTPEKVRRFEKEQLLFNQKWQSTIVNDIYYNRNLSLSHPFLVDIPILG